jgi:RimJ/RimL family protein N-acetyltransferase
MEIYPSLYQGELVRLTYIDPEKDAQIESGWTHDPEYLRMLDPDMAIPQSAFQIKKRYEKLEKEMDASGNQFYFAVREKASQEAESLGRLVGFARIYWIEWSHGSAMLSLGIGSPQDRGKGYGTETLQLILRYAFDELNLFRLAVPVAQYNQVALGLFGKAGFVEEVRQREALERYGRRWDVVYLGLLRDEWNKSVKHEM